MIRRSATFAFLVLVAVSPVVLTRVDAQRRLGPFSHNTRAHREGKYADCASCHSLPTRNWQTRSEFPDAATYPYHTSCFACHTRDIYTNGAVFCGTCHTERSMRARGGAGVLAFPARGHARQFNTIFPHDVHQDLIARSPMRATQAVSFVTAAFRAADDKPKPEFYNCAICHKTEKKMPRYAPRSFAGLSPLVDAAADTFERPVTPSFFKDSPTGHASCFTCHYQYRNLPVEKRSCAGCHALTQPYVEKRGTERYSIKFDHDRAGHVERDCASCHVRITQHSDLRSMKDADVPIAACWGCHAVQEDRRDRRILTIEIEAREASIANKQPPFQCTYCHTTAVGRYEIPPSHRKP